MRVVAHLGVGGVQHILTMVLVARLQVVVIVPVVWQLAMHVLVALVMSVPGELAVTALLLVDCWPPVVVLRQLTVVMLLATFLADYGTCGWRASR